MPPYSGRRSASTTSGSSPSATAFQLPASATSFPARTARDARFSRWAPAASSANRSERSRSGQVSSIGGITAFQNVGIYHASKWALEGFSQSLAQEVAPFNIHLTLIEPGAVDTELPDHNNPEMQEALRKRFEGVERLTADDIARAIVYAIGQPGHVAINEVLVRPTRQLG